MAASLEPLHRILDESRHSLVGVRALSTNMAVLFSVWIKALYYRLTNKQPRQAARAEAADFGRRGTAAWLAEGARFSSESMCAMSDYVRNVVSKHRNMTSCVKNDMGKDGTISFI